MYLRDDVETLLLERDICTGTSNQYRRSVRCFSEHLCEPARRSHLIETRVNQWLASLDGCRQPETIRGRKAGITAVWNWLAEVGELPAYNPNRLRRIKVPEKPPRAWSVEDVQTLLAAAKTVRGSLKCGVPASKLLTAWIWLGYESGLRPSDILRIRVDQVSESVAITQHKTSKPHCFRLSDAALDALKPLLIDGREEVFGLPRSTARRWELKLFEAAEQLGFKRRRGQGLGTLRKTHGTEVCRLSGINDAAKSLGHVSGTLCARRFYVQPDAIASPPAPPRLSHVNSIRTNPADSG